MQGAPPPLPPIIFERLKLPQQIIYRRKGNLSESPNHFKLAMSGYPGIRHFPGYIFLPKNSGAECQFLRKTLMHGNILLGNRPNFFIEHMTKSQNQPYRFKSGKNTFPWAKLLIT